MYDLNKVVSIKNETKKKKTKNLTNLSKQQNFLLKNKRKICVYIINKNT